jgi:hypothetical protein
MKKRITVMAAELGTTEEEIMKIAGEKLTRAQYTGTGKNTWFTEAGQKVVETALFIPEAAPKKLIGWVLAECRNPRWVWATIEGKQGKHPVLIPARLRGKLIAKQIAIDAITDINGTTFRHESLGQ